MFIEKARNHQDDKDNGDGDDNDNNKCKPEGGNYYSQSYGKIVNKGTLIVCLDY